MTMNCVSFTGILKRTLTKSLMPFQSGVITPNIKQQIPTRRKKKQGRSNGVEIDTEKAHRLLQKVIIREKTNIKSKELNDMQMVAKIKKMIQEEVECY